MMRTRGDGSAIVAGLRWILFSLTKFPVQNPGSRSVVFARAKGGLSGFGGLAR